MNKFEPGSYKESIRRKRPNNFNLHFIWKCQVFSTLWKPASTVSTVQEDRAPAMAPGAQGHSAP